MSVDPRKLVFTSLLLSACADDPPATGEPTPDDAPVWYPEVQTLVLRQCGGCHVDGGEAPFALDDYALARATAPAMLAAIEDGSMPPWHADPACQHFTGERVLGDADKATLRAWVAAGTPEGDPADAAAIEPATPPGFTPSFVGVVPGYTPSAAELDDWRCFVMPEIEFTQETWLVGSEVVPGSPAVHHAIISALAPELVADALAADAADPGPGYSCFGGLLPGMDLSEGMGFPTTSFPNQIGIWVPGLQAELLTDGTARQVAPGSLVVAQVHYNLLSVEPTPDHTEVRLLASDAPPQRLRSTGQLHYYDLKIPAGAASTSFTSHLPYHAADPLELVAFTGHMHLLGSSIGARARTPDDAEVCLVEVPRWDFHWQQRYSKPVAEALVLPSGSALTLTCAYDNSAANQPVVAGVQQPPRAVGWGESSLDEMCLMFVERLEDYAPLPAADAGACSASADCLAGCTGSQTRCLLECEATEFACVACVVNAVPGCAIDCAAPLAGEMQCLEACALATLMLDGNFGACFAAECGGVYDTFTACLDGRIADGSCTAPLAACGAEL